MCHRNWYRKIEVKIQAIAVFPRPQTAKQLNNSWVCWIFTGDSFPEQQQHKPRCTIFCRKTTRAKHRCSGRQKLRNYSTSTSAEPSECNVARASPVQCTARHCECSFRLCRRSNSTTSGRRKLVTISLFSRKFRIRSNVTRSICSLGRRWSWERIAFQQMKIMNQVHFRSTQAAVNEVRTHPYWHPRTVASIRRI